MNPHIGAEQKFSVGFMVPLAVTALLMVVLRLWFDIINSNAKMRARFELLEKRLFHGGDAAQDDPLPKPPTDNEEPTISSKTSIPSSTSSSSSPSSPSPPNVSVDVTLPPQHQRGFKLAIEDKEAKSSAIIDEEPTSGTFIIFSPSLDQFYHFYLVPGLGLSIAIPHFPFHDMVCDDCRYCH